MDADEEETPVPDRPRVALASARAAWGIDPDEPALLAALAEVGVDAGVLAWDDPSAEPGAYDLVVLRSTWDYAERRTAFLDWVRATAAVTRLHNPPAIVTANTDKRYLDDLAAKGVPTVPTRFFPPGATVVLPTERTCVVKPAVSAGSRNTLRVAPSAHARATALADELHAQGRVVMVQPYIDSVDARGETAVVFIDGHLSHGAAKGPILPPGSGVIDGLHAVEELAARQPSAAELAVAESALTALGADGLLYARVDLVADADGDPLVLEVELTEPSLFLRYAEGATARFAAAIAARAGDRSAASGTAPDQPHR